MTMYRHRTAGITLFTASVFSIVIMQHHPQRFNDGPMIGIVHGILIGLIWVMTTCLVRIALVQGLSDFRNLMGITSLVTASLANGFAGMINGFVTPSLMEKLEGESLQEWTTLCWTFNQSAAVIGAVGVSVGMFLWSSSWVRLPSRMSFRIVAITGLTGSFVCLGVLIAHRGELQVHAATLVYAIQSLWYALVGIDQALSPTQPTNRESDL